MRGPGTRVQLSFTQLAIFTKKNCICINFPWNIYVPRWIHGNCIFAYIDPKQQNVRKYTIHEWYGCCFFLSTLLDSTKSTYFRPTGLMNLRTSEKNMLPSWHRIKRATRPSKNARIRGSVWNKKGSSFFFKFMRMLRAITFKMEEWSLRSRDTLLFKKRDFSLVVGSYESITNPIGFVVFKVFYSVFRFWTPFVFFLIFLGRWRFPVWWAVVFQVSWNNMKQEAMSWSSKRTYTAILFVSTKVHVSVCKFAFCMSTRLVGKGENPCVDGVHSWKWFKQI